MLEDVTEFETTPDGKKITKLEQILLNGNNITMLVPGGDGPEENWTASLTTTSLYHLVIFVGLNVRSWWNFQLKTRRLWACLSSKMHYFDYLKNSNEQLDFWEVVRFKNTHVIHRLNLFGEVYESFFTGPHFRQALFKNNQ